jgi:hypothetical protein
MAQRRRRRARCMLHCPQRHVLGMRGWISACALRARCGGSDRGARWRTACYGNRDGCTHTDAHDRYPDFIPRPDETPSPNGQHAHVTHPVPDIVIEICWLTRSSPSNGQVLRFSVDSPQCHSVFLADARDPRVSFRSTHSASTNPSFPSAAFLRLLFASSCKKLPLNLCIERRVDDDFSYRNSSRLGLQLTRFS